jgi:hypothetical protein
MQLESVQRLTRQKEEADNAAAKARDLAWRASGRPQTGVREERGRENTPLYDPDRWRDTPKHFDDDCRVVLERPTFGKVRSDVRARSLSPPFPFTFMAIQRRLRSVSSRAWNARGPGLSLSLLTSLFAHKSESLHSAWLWRRMTTEPYVDGVAMMSPHLGSTDERTGY